MRRAFTDLTARHQLPWLVGTAMVVLVGCAALLWLVHARLDDARVRQAEAAASLAEMQALVASFHALQQARGADRDTPSANLTATVNQSLQGRSFQPSRIQQGSAGELQLRLDNVPFNAVVEWLLALENTGVVALRTIAVTQGQQGSASITLTLESLGANPVRDLVPGSQLRR